MIFLDKPFVSNFLIETIKNNAFPVVKTDIAEELGFKNYPHLLDEQQAIQIAKTEGAQIYTTSENSIGWISKYLSFTELPKKINLFKDKAKFRKLIQSIYPDFFFREIKLDELENLSIDKIPMPFIIKPTVGFFSMGVYKVANSQAWVRTLAAIKSEMQRVEGLYPVDVMDATSFIIEENIDGEEFAIDAYFNANGTPIILNIYKHLFSSDGDVSDRIYISSKTIIEENIEAFTAFLKNIGALSGVKNFPVHAEIRRDANGLILPVEINPMRFGGWCTTADMTYFAYGFNPYEYYFSQRRPNWDELLRDKAGKIYSIVVLDNSTGIDTEKISAFDYDSLLATFKKPLELRKIDYKAYPVFGFVFTETKEENLAELEYILKSDLREFITT